MVKLSSTNLLVAFGGLALSLTTGVGIASAEPDLSPMINTTCSYPQVMAAINAQAPGLAAEFSANPLAPVWLREFLASPLDQRKQILQQMQGTPAQQYAGQARQAFSTCNNY